LLTDLNNSEKYDLSGPLELFLLDDDVPNPYLGVTLNSLFYDIPSIASKFKNTTCPIFLSLNVQSLPSKYEQLKSLICSLMQCGVPIYAIALQEIWNIPHLDDLALPGFNLIVNMRKKSRGGGVGFYIRENTKCNVIKHLTVMNEKIFESIAAEVFINKKKYILANYYRSPNSPPNFTPSEAINDFIEHLHGFLNSINNSDCQSYVFSDTNINVLKLLNDQTASNYFNTTTINGFLMTNTKASRIQGLSYGLLDHILTNKPSDIITTGTIITDLSDHFPLFVCDNHPCNKPPDEFFYTRSFSNYNLNKFKTSLASTDWNPVVSCQNVNSSYDLFWNIFKGKYDDCFPLKRIKRNKNIHKINNFMTQGLLVSRRTKNLLLKTSLISPTEFNINSYKSYRNLYNKILRKSKLLYFENSFKAHCKNQKKTWELIGEALNKQTVTSSIPEILVQDMTLTNDTDKANAFNSFFSNVGPSVYNSVPTTTRTPESFVPENPEVPLLDFGNIGPIYVSDIIKSLPNKSSADLDGVSLKLVKTVRTEICTPLAHIFDLSISTGIFPDALKCSRTVPVYKCGSKSLCDNYRPISLVPTFSKLLEKIIAVKLSNHLDINKLLHKHQFGFQRGKQTEHNLLLLLDKVSKSLNEGKFCLGIFLDIKKAFDCVSHDILFKKLHKLGIRENALSWFKSYLSNRTQKCDVNGKLSDTCNIDIGVLQGSTLGPILFLCFINDLPSSTLLHSLLFADDTACLVSHDSLPELFEIANRELHKIAVWFKANKLAVNVKKTKFIIFHLRQKVVNIANLKLYYNDNDLDVPQDPDKLTEIERITCKNDDDNDKTYKYLGILLDEHLSFDFHVNYLCKKLSRALYFMSKTKNIVNANTRKNLYFALFHPHLLYCTNIFSCTTGKNITKLALLQKKAIRLITGSHYTAPTKELFHRLGILPFDKIITFQKASLMHSIFYAYSPTTVVDLFPKSLNDHEHDLRRFNNFAIPRPRNEFFKKMPPFNFPSLWNSLEESKLYHNRVTFQTALKFKLLNELLS